MDEQEAERQYRTLASLSSPLESRWAFRVRNSLYHCWRFANLLGFKGGITKRLVNPLRSH